MANTSLLIKEAEKAALVLPSANRGPRLSTSMSSSAARPDRVQRRPALKMRG